MTRRRCEPEAVRAASRSGESDGRAGQSAHPSGTARAGQPGETGTFQPPADWVVTYTTAPTDYDWFGTRTMSTHEWQSGKTVREVVSNPRHVESQRDRYRSGLVYLVTDAEGWAELQEVPW